MADLFAELSGDRVIEARVCIPMFGAWHADIVIDKEVTPAASGLRLVIADLVMTCAVWRDARAYQGKTQLRLIGGAGGWSRVVPAKGYSSPGGVRLSLVLGDLAKAAGESIAIGEDRSVGRHYSRDKAPAARHLNWLVPRAWWIDPNGTTRTGTRPTSVIASPFSIISFDGSRGAAMIATEKPADFVPGRTLQGFTLNSTITIGAVTHVVSKGSIRSEVLAS